MESPITAKAALLQALRSGPGYGIDLIQRVAKLTRGRVRLLQGAVYPALKALETEGLVKSWAVVPGRRRGGRSRTYYELTLRGVAVSDTQRRTLADLSDRRPAPLGSPVEEKRLLERLRRAARVTEFALSLRRRARFSTSSAK